MNIFVVGVIALIVGTFLGVLVGSWCCAAGRDRIERERIMPKVSVKNDILSIQTTENTPPGNYAIMMQSGAVPLKLIFTMVVVEKEGKLEYGWSQKDAEEAAKWYREHPEELIGG